jgi:hypothetical protein
VSGIAILFAGVRFIHDNLKHKTTGRLISTERALQLPGHRTTDG